MLPTAASAHPLVLPGFQSNEESETAYTGVDTPQNCSKAATAPLTQEPEVMNLATTITRGWGGVGEVRSSIRCRVHSVAATTATQEMLPGVK